MRAPSSILITGASGAIGGALAARYAAPGVTLVLSGRNVERLNALADACRGRGARVETAVIDVADTEALRDSMAALDAEHRFDLVIINQGVNAAVAGDTGLESWHDAQRVVDVNLRAAIAIVHGVVPGLRARGGGQLALVSSLAAYVGLPLVPTYSASKAALKAYAEALRGALAASNIQVSVVMPGYVESAMCRAMPGPKPFLWDAARAARVIARGLARDRARISFPGLLATGVFLLSVLPPALAQLILKWLGYRAR